MSLRKNVGKWLKLTAGGALLLVAGLAILEQVLEARERAALTASDSFFVIHGKRVRYRLLGADRPGPTIVLLAGAMGSLEQWDDVQKQLGQHAPVLAYDRGGMGFSDFSDAHDAVAQAEELSQLLRAPGVPPGALVIGYSSSAYTATLLAELHRDQVVGLAYLDPSTLYAHGYPPPSTHSFRREYRGLFTTQVVQPLLGLARLKHYLLFRHTPAQTPAEERARVILAESHHWIATLRDVWLMDQSSARAEEAPGFGELPIAVMSTCHSESCAAMLADQRKLLARSSNATFVPGDGLEHGAILEPENDARVVAYILGAEDRVRASLGAAKVQSTANAPR